MSEADDSLDMAKDAVDGALSLAREFYKMMGYEVPKGYRFDTARHPQERLCWRMACHAYDQIDGTEIDECLAEISESQ